MPHFSIKKASLQKISELVNISTIDINPEERQECPYNNS